MSGSSVPYWSLSPHVQPVPHYQPCDPAMAIYETHGHYRQSSESTLEVLSGILYPVEFDKMYQGSITHNSVIIL